MRKGLLICLLITILSVTMAAFSIAQDTKADPKATPAVVAKTASGAMAAGPAAPTPPRRPNFAIIFGSVTKINSSDPAKPKIEVKSDADGTTHMVDVTPWTNVTKVTDMSELKTGDTVRIMARKVDNAEVAMTIVFGKIRNVYAPRSARPATTAATPPAAATTKK